MSPDENHHRDPYTVVVWERHGQWAARLRQSVKVEVDWCETRSWQQCQAAVEAMSPGCVVMVPSDDVVLGECVERIQQLRRLHPATLLTVIQAAVIQEAVIGRPIWRSFEWVLREAGAAEVAADAIGAERIARLIERDAQRRPPSQRPLTRLIMDQLPWRSQATGR